MRYDGKKHHRRSIRLPDHDYRSPGAYFVTICNHQGDLLFDDVLDGDVTLNEYGQVVRHCWICIPEHFSNVELDAWVVMPNHLHGILVITDLAGALVGAQHAAPLPSHWINVQPRSLAAIVRSFKSAATRRINRMRSMRGLRGTPGAPVWQQNYYEHIIRSDAALERVREYLKHNPARWPAARLHPIAPKSIKSIAGAGHAY